MRVYVGMDVHRKRSQVALLDERGGQLLNRNLVNDSALIDAIGPLITRLERDLLARSRPDPRFQALQALPGIGPITAMTLVAEIDDTGRLPTARKLCLNHGRWTD